MRKKTPYPVVLDTHLTPTTVWVQCIARSLELPTFASTSEIGRKLADLQYEVADVQVVMLGKTDESAVFFDR